MTRNPNILNIGITGEMGFVGTHLFNFLNLQEGIQLVNFKKSFFDEEKQLLDFVKQCDVIVHLAALNRHNDQEKIYQVNVGLTGKLIHAMEAAGVAPHVIFSSSTQEERDNVYGNSKKESRKLFEKWAVKHNAIFTGMIIPNVFGPFGKPYYNSVIATFSHQLTHGESTKIHIDGSLKLIYVGELVEAITKIIRENQSGAEYLISHTAEIKVSEILKLLEKYKQEYFESNMFPQIQSKFELNLFNTFRSYIDYKNHFPVILKKNTDNRGSFIEIVKTESGGQFSFSNTHAGVTRGNHFHTRKIERFTVISGKAAIELRRMGTNEKLHFELDGDQPSLVDMPVWYTHNITNTGSEELLTLFWINEFFDPNDPDTFFEKV